MALIHAPHMTHRQGRASSAPTAPARYHALLLVMLAAGACGAPIPFESTYRLPESSVPDAWTVLADNTAINGTLLRTTTAASELACSAACREAAPACSMFEYCGVQGGCSNGSPEPQPYQQCRLLSIGCQVQPQALLAAGPNATTMFGFPAQPLPYHVYGFNQRQGAGIMGGDFSCSFSKLPGSCAFFNPIDALFMCTTLSNPPCRAVVYYANGTDGCSPPLAVLKSVGMSGNLNAFVSPSVVTLEQSESMPAVFLRLYESEGWVEGTPSEELSSRAYVAPANSSEYLGSMMANACIMDGELLVTEGGVQSPEECSRLCRGWMAETGKSCNVWTHCNVTNGAAGCNYTSTQLNQQSLQLQAGQCQLRFQEMAAVQAGWPPALLAKGPANGVAAFTCGAPLVAWGPQVSGFKRIIGKALYTWGRYNCTDSLRPEMLECVRPGTVEEVRQTCLGDPQCVAFTLKPGGALRLDQDIGIFKANADPSMVILNPTAVTYLMDGLVNGAKPSAASADSGGLSAGAIAGIVVGSVAAVAALLLGAALWARRRRAVSRDAPPPSPKTPRDSVDSLEAGRLGGPAAGPLPAGAQQYAVGAAQLLRSPSSDLVSPFSAAAAGEAHFGSKKPSPPTTTTTSSGQLAAGAAAAAAAAAAGGRLGSAERASTASAAGSGSLGRPPLAAYGAGLSPQRTMQRHVSFQPEPASTPGTAGTAASPPSTRPSGALPSRGDSMASGSSGALCAGGTNGARASGRAPLPELVAHVAEYERADTASVGSGASAEERHQPVSVEQLPPRLREWVVPASDVSYLRWPNGRLREIGSGASAHVYKVMYHGEVIAAKEMDIGRSKATQEAFLTEALRLQGLRHPHIISFFGVMLQGDKGTVLMEYAEGRDLHSALEVLAAGSSERLFGWHRRGRRVAFEIAKALNFLHANSVVHMDVKSSNVLLTASGTAKLADVAFSRQLEHTFLSDLPLLGTWAWIAPEVLLGGRQCTAAVDIYSFGVVLWEIITGLRPSRGNMRMPRVPEECPQEVADLTMHCLSEDPADRPTAQELLHRLHVLMERRPAERRAVSAGPSAHVPSSQSPSSQSPSAQSPSAQSPTPDFQALVADQRQ